MPKYRIYASLLDSFDWYLRSEKEESFQELIDKINRVPFTSEAAERGTDFNTCIDYLLCGEGEQQTYLDLINKHEFSREVILEVCGKMVKPIPQHRTSGILQTSKGDVELYGDVDYIEFTKAIDLKTTKNYELGKYANSWQRKVYPFCLRSEGIEIDTFEFLVTDFEHVYREPYPVDPLGDMMDLINITEHFIEFLEANRDKITDKKIFNQLEEAA